MGWTRATAYVALGPRLSPSGSATSVLKQLIIAQFLAMRKHEQVMRDHAICRAMLAGGEQDPKVSGELEQKFWEIWRGYMRYAFPYDDELRKEKADRMREYMEKHVDEAPLMVVPMAPPRRPRRQQAREVMPGRRRRRR